MTKRHLPITKQEGAPTHWRSPSHLAMTPDVRESMAREFPAGTSELDGASRRGFLGLMSASFALMGLTGCVRRPEEKILPYTHAPEGLIPGVAQYYATSLPLFGDALGVIVESHEGRPTKIEGNPDHPGSLGGTHAILQAMVLELYDPDRAQASTINGADVPTSDVDNALRGRLAAAEGDGGARLRVLTGASSSVSLARLKQLAQKRFPRAKFYEYESASASQATAGAKLALGKAARALYAYDKARVIFAADSDFLQTEPGAVANNRLFSRGRRVRTHHDGMSRLYVAEPALTTTGANADERLRVPAGGVEDVLLALAAELGRNGIALAPFATKPRSGAVDPKWIATLARDLAQNRGASAVVVGARQAASTHALGLAINEALGNVGKTVRFAPVPDAADHAADIKSLAGEMTARVVDTLLVLGGNPVYDAPGDVRFGEALANVPHRFYLASHPNETAEKCNYTLPRAHALETWGDETAADGTVSIAQPLIAPLYNGRSDIEVLAAVAKLPSQRGYDIVRDTFSVANGGAQTATQGTTHAENAGTADAHATTDTTAPHGHSDATAPVASSQPTAVVNAHGAKATVPAAKAPPPAPASAASATPVASASAQHPGAHPRAAASSLMTIGAAASPFASARPMGSVVAPVGSAAPSADAVAAVAAIPPHTVASSSAQISESAWRRALHDGFVSGSASAVMADARVDVAAVAAAVGRRAAAAPTPQALELSFAPDPAVYDGRYANVAWLLELPHPITKMVWDNAAWVSVKTAGDLGLKSGDVVRLTSDGRSIDIPVWIVPGTADNCVALHLGWGHTRAGRVGNGAGVNVAPLRSSQAFFVAQGASLSKTGNVYNLVVTQEHNMIEGRPIIRENTLAGYRNDPTYVEKQDEHPPLISLWDERTYEGHKWGMVVDMTACTGCNACVIACQAENNVPVVGKEQVERQREMHWLRLDRYFSGTVEDPKTVYQPMACVHCENAPCENVCPVNATSHSPEGINEMTYNRCIGTRYCSNNCPYKVRRFNFLDYHGSVPETVKMASNPNVSVRMRGVMEKCSYCIQRIQNAKIAAKRDHRTLRDGDVVSACAQACPADAITFGDLNDPHSRVAKLANVEHGFRVLEELNTKPRTTHLAKIRNPNPELA